MSCLGSIFVYKLAKKLYGRRVGLISVAYTGVPSSARQRDILTFKLPLNRQSMRYMSRPPASSTMLPGHSVTYSRLQLCRRAYISGRFLRWTCLDRRWSGTAGTAHQRNLKQYVTLSPLHFGNSRNLGISTLLLGFSCAIRPTAALHLLPMITRTLWHNRRSFSNLLAIVTCILSIAYESRSYHHTRHT